MTDRKFTVSLYELFEIKLEGEKTSDLKKNNYDVMLITADANLKDPHIMKYCSAVVKGLEQASFRKIPMGVHMSSGVKVNAPAWKHDAVLLIGPKV